MTHAAHEIAVGGGDAPLSGGQNPHVAAKAGPAGGGRDDAARIQEDIRIAPAHALPIDALGGGDNDAPDPLRQMASL